MQVPGRNKHGWWWLHLWPIISNTTKPCMSLTLFSHEFSLILYPHIITHIVPCHPHLYFMHTSPPTYPQNMYSAIPAYAPPTAGPGGRNRPPLQGLHGTTITPGATPDQAHQIREVVLEVLSQLVSKVVCNITPTYPLLISPQYPQRW